MLRVAFCHRYKAIALLTCLALGVSEAYAIPGVDGSLTVTAANTQLNRYAPVTAVVGNTVTVTDITLLNRGAVGHFANNALSPGDLILIYQAQGATFTDSSNTATYGAFDVQNAGRFEYAEVLSTTGNNIVLCSNAVNTYSPTTGRVQVVRVPQYRTLTVTSGASVVAADWNGTSGGIVALNVAGTLTVNGQVNVDSRGFRGGARNTVGAFTQTAYRSTSATLGAEKGESILGFGTEYDVPANGGRYGRGAPANGGGGGNGHNAAGGGGANGNSAGTWTGAGDPALTPENWRCAWDLDDGVDNGTANDATCTNPTGMGVIPPYFSSGAGGGRGGYTYGANNSNANTTSPGNTAWGGDNRRQVGGLGGRPLTNDPASRLFFGGGGGGGENNNNAGTNGARGGGLILVDAGSLAGSGTLSANGGTVTTNAANDGSGGGGGGGTIAVRTVSAPSTGIVLSAAGGRGGNQALGNNESEGPGGGGGGGYIRVIGGATFTTPPSVSGGANGTSSSSAVTEFLPNGATRGYPGLYQAANFTFPGAQQCAWDYGDSPDSYGTTLTTDGARHVITPGLQLGAAIDREADGQPAPPGVDAIGDDNNPVGGPDDEDGVTFQTTAGPGFQIIAAVTGEIGTPAAGEAILCGYLDGAANGSVNSLFDRSVNYVNGVGLPGAVSGSGNEELCVRVSGSPNNVVLGPVSGFNGASVSCTNAAPNGSFLCTFFFNPNFTTPLTTYARFRLTRDPAFFNNASPSPTGAANSGELEDYRILVSPTAVTIGSVDLKAEAVTGFLDGLDVGGMSDAELLALLAAWDPAAAEALAGADREAILAALGRYLDPDGNGQVAVLRWDTLEQRGTVGFYVDRRVGDGDWQRINGDMLPALIGAPLGGEYRLADPTARAGERYEYTLIEQEAWGSTRSYGPFSLELAK